MSVAWRNPNRIWLGGPGTPGGADHGADIGMCRASAAIVPGDFIEFHDVSDESKLRKFSTANEMPPRMVALRKSNNGGIDDAYAAGDLVNYLVIQPGTILYAWALSAATVTNAELLECGAGGRLTDAGATTAAAGDAVFQSLEELNSGSAITADTRCRVKVMG